MGDSFCTLMRPHSVGHSCGLTLTDTVSAFVFPFNGLSLSRFVSDFLPFFSFLLFLFVSFFSFTLLFFLFPLLRFFFFAFLLSFVSRNEKTWKEMRARGKKAHARVRTVVSLACCYFSFAFLLLSRYPVVVPPFFSPFVPFLCYPFLCSEENLRMKGIEGRSQSMPMQFCIETARCQGLTNRLLGEIEEK